MGQTTVRITERTRDRLRELAREEGLTMQAVLDRAVEEHRRRRFLERVNAAYAELREDADEWQALLAEREEWEATLGDGLPPEEEAWDADGDVSGGEAADGRAP